MKNMKKKVLLAGMSLLVMTMVCYGSFHKEKTESDTLIAEANSTITSKQKDIQELMADIDEINKRIDMKNKEKSDLGL